MIEVDIKKLVKCQQHDEDRLRVQKETLTIIQDPQGPIPILRARALENHARWKAEYEEKVRSGALVRSPRKVSVIAGDWGVVAQRLAKETGEIPGVLNMANAHAPGGGYLQGMRAQEENIYRRTDCHNFIKESEVHLPINYDEQVIFYNQEMTDLINAKNNEVYLDTEHQRLCFRGPETAIPPATKSYDSLEQDDCFLFYEMKSAALDLRIPNKNKYRKFTTIDAAEMRNRIRAQLSTLVEKDVRNVVLGAFGCGAFGNPGDQIAKIYAEELAEFGGYFDNVVFAVYDGGYGPKNFPHFNEAFENLTLPDSLPKEDILVFKQKLGNIRDYINDNAAGCLDTYPTYTKVSPILFRKPYTIPKEHSTEFKTIKTILNAAMPLHIKLSKIEDCCNIGQQAIAKYIGNSNELTELHRISARYEAIKNIIRGDMVPDAAASPPGSSS